MAKFLKFVFEGSQVAGLAELLESEAPKTCKAIWDHLPYEGAAGHAMLSGTICALYIDSRIVAPTENATSHVTTDDVVFVHYEEGERHGYLDSLSEICWAYDRYVRPTSPGMMRPVYPNIFARLLPEQTPFKDLCRRIRREGSKPMRIVGESR